MNNEDKVYYEQGAAIEFMGQKLLLIHPTNVENNFSELENGNLKINWIEALNMYEKFITKQTNFELKVTIYGKMIASISFASFAAMQQFFLQVDKGILKIQWQELLNRAKNKDYPAKISF